MRQTVLRDGGGEKLGQSGGVNGTTDEVGVWNLPVRYMPASKARLG
jgi:hypothetical protein